MNIQEAVKTGRPFRRSGWDTWLLNIKNEIRYSTGARSLVEFEAHELAADDWEIQPERFEFECSWKLSAFAGIIPVCIHPVDASQLIGKKTRVTVEVIDG